MPAHSLRPQLALRIGITGHRWRESQHAADERLDRSQATAVQVTLRKILQRVRAAAESLPSAHRELFAEGPSSFALVSALAEGADELAAAVALEPAVGYALDIVAPYDLATYAERCAPGTTTRALWDDARARLILDGQPFADEPQPGEHRARHEATLVETNRRLVWNSDLIVAVWDGREARGEAGTARVIERARAEGLPVIHIDSVHPDRVVLLDAAGAAPSTDNVWSAIDHVVARLLEPPHTASGHDSQHGEGSNGVPRALADWINETAPGAMVRSVGARVYQVAQWLLAGAHSPHPLRAMASSPDAIGVPWRPIAIASEMSARRTAYIDPAYQRADYFAVAYGARHRSTFTTILFAAPFAVVCAWVGSLVSEAHRLPWAVAELTLLGILTTFFLRSRRRRFHEKWLDYRLLAERVRHLGFLWPLGRTSPVIRVPTHAVVTDPRPAWVNWWYRALTRQLGLAPVQLDATTVRALADQIATDLVDAQLAYNRATHSVAHRAEHRLHFIPWIPLLMALGAALTHVLENLHLLHLDHTIVVTLTGIGIIGPAFGAALHGFASQAGYQEVGIRTDASAQQLERFAQRLAVIDCTRPLASKALGDLALSVADVMGEDLAGWRVDYLARPINPPG